MGGRGSGGNRAKPAWLKVIEGNRGKRKIEPALDADGKLPPPPEYLTKAQAACWNEVVVSLPTHVLKRADQSVVERCAIAWAMFREAADFINRSGLLTRAENGRLRRNPMIPVRVHAARELAAAGAELGLSPLSRSRLGALDSFTNDPMDMLLDSQDWANLLPSDDDLLKAHDDATISQADAKPKKSRKKPEPATD
jgi:P27 family predicted phage terminase small subunit